MTNRNQTAVHVGGTALLSAIVYVLTCAPGLYYTDSGELSAAASVLGVAHPTGYPLFTLLAHLWTFLPFSSVVGGLNIFNAIVMACAAGGLTAVTAEVLKRTSNTSTTTRWLVADATALVAAFSTTIWAQATTIEVYALNALLLVLALLATLRSGNNAAYTALAGLVVGLMIANHLSAVFLTPGLLVLWWMQQSEPTTRKQLLPWVFAPTLVGASLYVLLPLRSAQEPPINWGFVHRGWDAFLYHVKGTQFGVWMFSDKDAMAANVDTFFALATNQLLWVGWIAVLYGVYILWKKSRPIAAGLVILIAGNLMISFGYAIPDIESYFVPTFIALSILIAVGLAAVIKNVSEKSSFALLLLPVVPLALNLEQNDLSDHRAVESYTEWTLANAEPNAIIFTRQWDFLCSAFWYQQTVEGVRPDVAMIDKELLRRTWYLPYLQQRYPDIFEGAEQAIDGYRPWLAQFESDAESFNANPRNGAEIQRRFVALLNSIVEANPDRPIYLTPEIINDEQGFAVGYDAIPVGPLLRLTKNTGVQTSTILTGVKDFTDGVGSHSTRLDSSIKSVVLNALATDALFAAQNVGNTSAYKELYRAIVDLDKSGAIPRALDQRVGKLE